MGNELKPCNDPCCKCGSKDIHRNHYFKDEGVYNESFDRCKNKHATGSYHNFIATREHIDHMCKCCHYRWQTAVQ